MQRSIGVISIAILFTALLAGEARAQAAEADLARGAKLYADNCGRCHNPRAATELSDRDWPIVVRHMRVAAGLPGEQARAIDAFLRASNNPPRPEPVVRTAAVAGPKLIDSHGCRGCHLIGGQGGTIGPNLDGVFQRREDEWIRLKIQSPRASNPASVMPDFGFSEAQVNAIVETLRRQH